MHCPLCLVGSEDADCWICGGPMKLGRVHTLGVCRRWHDASMEAAITSYQPAEPIEYKVMDDLVWAPRNWLDAEHEFCDNEGSLVKKVFLAH